MAATQFRHGQYALLLFKLSIMMTLTVSLLLILWDFPTQPFLGFIEKEKDKNPASGSSLGENV